ncbi:MAG: ROK family protein [Omnitrophica WOR_2 bacterium]
MKKYIGCDLGGTNLRAGIVDLENGEISHLTSIPTQAREGHEAVMDRMAGLLKDIITQSGLEQEDFGGIGIGVPGRLDLKRGRVVFLPNLPGTWPDVPLADTIQQKTNLPVYLLNDVRAITYGEWKFGAGRGANTIACFAIGTGIGGGLVINGKLHLGIGGTAGELGHQTIDMNGPVCGCGNRGCLEVYASGPAIAAMGMKAVVQGLTTLIGEYAEYDLNKITPELVCRAALEGDPVAKDIYERAGTCLGIGISNVIVSIGPRRVIIGGGVSQAGELLLEPARRTIKERVTIMPVEEVEVVLAALGNDAGVLGVAAWAAERRRE